MPRIIMVSGKGGVGKTTVAAATGLAAARRGKRTLVLSFDLAHSLADSFDLQEELFLNSRGAELQLSDNLFVQEIDIQEELDCHWQDLFRVSTSLMMGGGLDRIMAEEVAVMPGMEDVVALLRLNQHVISGGWDVIVVDCPPTGESLRFVGITSSLDWYVRKRLKIDRKISNLVRPMGGLLGEASMMIPDDKWFESLIRLFQSLDGIDELLRDPATTTVRLVTNPEKMVVRETQRAFMYFCLYGMAIDSVVINRLLPVEDPFFEKWARSQANYSKLIGEYFDPVPVAAVPLFSDEVVGIPQLERFAELLFHGSDPAAVGIDAPSYGVEKNGDGGYRLTVRAPFVSKENVEISRRREDVTVRIGTFKRNILLPRKLAGLQTAGAEFEGDKLVIHFSGRSNDDL